MSLRGEYGKVNNIHRHKLVSTAFGVESWMSLAKLVFVPEFFIGDSVYLP